ncbi:hypothetical protein [Enterobacter ludwigii]|uniref:hypothetical protein n=1 Tax=Enterobacter ludwigii TaxID=299767 RepID=UPI001E611A54|nr:hypothetical protein [Enterobacter ludwigii]MCE2008912.1 hypothetical protein [Enterobacter ludwigii]
MAEGNVFSGFETDKLADAFGITPELAAQLLTQSTARGDLIKIATNLVLTSPNVPRTSG